MLAAGYALVTPRWNNPDEPAHFNYVRELAETGRLPVIKPGDWDAETLERLKSAGFPDDDAIGGIRYEAHQPPLYYLLAAPIFRLTEGFSLSVQVLALRGLSILFGAVVVAAAFAASRQVFPSRHDVALLAAATVAFIPMHTAIAAAVNNDSLGNALAAVTLVLLLRGIRHGFDDRLAVVLGLVLGAIVLTKVTAYPYVPLAIGVVVLSESALAGSRKLERWSAIFRRPVLALVAAALISSWWLVRNVATYGLADPLAAARHADVVVGQPRWAMLDATAVDYFSRVLFRSFWGQFGWMGIVLDDRVYLLYLLLTALGVLGMVLALVSSEPGPPTSDPLRESGWERYVRRCQAATLAAAGLLVVAGVVYYNLTFIQPQGRYLFAALVPIGLLLALGWRRLAGSPTACPVAPRGSLDRLAPALLAGAIAWALFDATALLLVRRFWSIEAVLACSALVACLRATVPAPPRDWAAAAPSFALGVGLGLLNLACLLRFLAPAIR